MCAEAPNSRSHGICQRACSTTPRCNTYVAWFLASRDAAARIQLRHELAHDFSSRVTICRDDIRSSEAPQVAEGMLEALLQGAIVAREDCEPRSTAQGREGGGGSIDFVMELIGGGFGSEGVAPHAVFDGPETAFAPLGCRHAVHAGAFAGVTGLKLGDVVLEKGVEIVGRFIFEDDGRALAAKTVAECVLGRAALASRGFGAGRVGRVGSRADDPSKRRHLTPPDFTVAGGGWRGRVRC